MRYLLIGLSFVMFLTACTPTAAEYNNQGNEAFADAAYDDAVQEYSAAKAADQALAEPYYNSGNAYHNQGDFKEAINQTQEALRRADDALAQQAFYNLGNSYYLTEDWAAAIKAYQEALVLDPTDQEAKYNLELALQQLQRAQQQQQQQQNGEGEPQPNQGNQPGQQDPGQQGQGEQEGQQGGGDEDEEQEGGGGDDQDEQEQGGGNGQLTPEEAEQLLDNLAQDGQTLQERLNQSFDGQGRRLYPEQDW